MRIAEVAEFYAPNGGGVRTYIDRKFVSAARAGHELFVLAPADHDGFEPREAGGVVWIKAPALPFDANYRMFWEAAPVHAQLDRLRPDLVETSSPWRGAWIAASWPGPAPRAMFMHADPVASYPHRWFGPVAGRDRVDRLFDWFWRYLQRLSRRFDTVVAGGGWLARRLQEHDIGPIEMIGLGIDRSAFSPGRRDEALRAHLLQTCALAPTAKLLLGVGRHHAEKRWPMVIQAAAAVGAELPIGLVLVGDGVDRAAVVRAAGGNPHVNLVAPIRDRPLLARMLASADALIHGCECETFGLIAAEALASATPLIAPDQGGCAEMAAPGVSETYAAADGQAAAAAIQRLFARDPRALRAACLSAATSVRADAEHFSALFEHYAQICDARALQAAAAVRSA